MLASAPAKPGADMLSAIESALRAARAGRRSHQAGGAASQILHPVARRWESFVTWLRRHDACVYRRDVMQDNMQRDARAHGDTVALHTYAHSYAMSTKSLN